MSKNILDDIYIIDKNLNNTLNTESTSTEIVTDDETSDVVIDIKYTNDTADNKSVYLTRELTIKLKHPLNGKYIIFAGNKMSISGAKYIGVQQDEFKITFQNINFSDFGKLVNSGFKEIEVLLGDDMVFLGNIKSINTGRDSIVERTIEINCLRKVTDLLADLVTPITLNSSINIWAVLADQGFQITHPANLNDFKLQDEVILKGNKKTVIDEMVKVINNELSRTTNSWIDYEYEEDGKINLFAPYTIKEVLVIEPYNGLIDAPTVSEDSVSFSAIYKTKLTPGQVVYMDNKLFKTLGNNSAFIYAWDPNGQYVITESRYSLSNYPNSYTISCKARPLSKYNNFTASLGG